MRLPEHIKSVASMPLQRPFQLFGKGFEVKLSSHLTMQPETVFWIATGMSLQQALENLSPDHAWAMKALRREILGQNQLSTTTVERIKQALFGHISSKVIRDESFNGLPDGAPWEVCRNAMLQAEGTDLYALVAQMADLEALPDRYKKLIAGGKKAEADFLLVEAIGHPDEYWDRHDISLPCYLVVDTALNVIAAGDWKSAATRESFERTRKSPSSALVRAGKKPLGHWLVKQQQLAGCKSLSQLIDKLPAQCEISLDRLKAWSSGVNLMPPAAAKELVRMLHSDADSEMNRYRMARCFSFLIEFIICCAMGKPPSWPEAQAMIEKRYCARLEHAIPQRS
jgi:hypothetical protein